MSRGSGAASLPTCQAHVGSTVDTAREWEGHGAEVGEGPGPPSGRSTKQSATCSAGRSGAPLALGPEGGAALRGGVQRSTPHPLKPKGDSHCVQSCSGPCGLCWGTKLRLDQTASLCPRSLVPWAPRLRDRGGGCEPGVPLACMPTQSRGAEEGSPKGNLGGPSRGRTPCGHS